jgi:carbon monoxide dehydrogenase subunit G
MATIIKHVQLSAKPEDVWNALADFGALHQRLVPGFVTTCEFDGEARTITFANGSVARELLVSSDAERRRLVYAIPANERIKHYSASAQVSDDGKGGAELAWTIDLLPNEIAPYVSGQMDLGAAAMQKAFAKKAA